MPRFFKATLKWLKSDEDGESVLTLRIPDEDYDRVTPVGKLRKQVLLIGVYTADEASDLAGEPILKGAHE